MSHFILQSLDEFFTNMEQLCSSSHLSILLRKPDKKKERWLIFVCLCDICYYIHNFKNIILNICSTFRIVCNFGLLIWLYIILHLFSLKCYYCTHLSPLLIFLYYFYLVCVYAKICNFLQLLTTYSNAIATYAYILDTLPISYLL